MATPHQVEIYLADYTTTEIAALCDQLIKALPDPCFTETYHNSAPHYGRVVAGDSVAQDGLYIGHRGSYTGDLKALKAPLVNISNVPSNQVTTVQKLWAEITGGEGTLTEVTFTPENHTMYPTVLVYDTTADQLDHIITACATHQIDPFVMQDPVITVDRTAIPYLLECSALLTAHNDELYGFAAETRRTEHHIDLHVYHRDGHPVEPATLHTPHGEYTCHPTRNGVQILDCPPALHDTINTILPTHQHRTHSNQLDLTEDDCAQLGNNSTELVTWVRTQRHKIWSDIKNTPGTFEVHFYPHCGSLEANHMATFAENHQLIHTFRIDEPPTPIWDETVEPEMWTVTTQTVTTQSSAVAVDRPHFTLYSVTPAQFTAALAHWQTITTKPMVVTQHPERPSPTTETVDVTFINLTHAQASQIYDLVTPYDCGIDFATNPGDRANPTDASFFVGCCPMPLLEKLRALPGIQPTITVSHEL